MDEYLKIGATIIAALGGSGAIILGLANYLGKIWANRLMVKEKAEHDRELEKLRTGLHQESQQNLAKLNSEIEVYKQTQLREHNDKLLIYRATIDLVATMLAKVEMIVLRNKQQLTAQEREQFEAERLKIYGYLAMIAPQEVMDANDVFIDQLLAVVFDGKYVSWEVIRSKALNLTNAMRKDIGIDKSEVSYNGER
ncbi:hypothetical protein AL536_02695 [Vibrio fluvialis]|uniref:Uncharacterized protein n=1 Tax=Vibrio fluvialis TaxID=676 RepID=A0AAX2LV69_VIBFL|nr:hypothetical protein [Vibrio fluvialis]AMF92406.1 hypothetical protein AL536_02695 [Vibrio fluvialis]EKO4009469.1 hypothetical protein [Vibrio fluvialis]MBY8225818.1 hypothetical protein [Vibrio fluvialis]MCE7635623.1 hypothetical protein [Vibrio fluvialis]MCE7657650.1 hypothetical protein [Vibrio fluvialis]